MRKGLRMSNAHRRAATVTRLSVVAWLVVAVAWCVAIVISVPRVVPAILAATLVVLPCTAIFVLIRNCRQ